MRYAYAMLGIAFLILIGVFVVLGSRSTSQTPNNQEFSDQQLANNNDTMQLTSTVFAHEGLIPAKYTCDASPPDGGTNPPLSITGVPEGTQSLVLIMDDPDVPKDRRPDGMFDHWVRFNIPADTTEIVEGVEPVGSAGSGTSGQKKYVGPCPPDREHRYFFKLYALDTMLDLPEGATKKEVEVALHGHVLEETQLMGRYNRPQNQ